MNIFEIFLIAIGLSMDAFAVAVCKGLSFQKADFKKSIIVGLYFGGFQAGMPILGYILGVQFRDNIDKIDHWIAFALLTIIGFNMIKEALSKEEVDENSSLSFKNMSILAIATSIDALAVGVTFAFLEVQIVIAVIMIGITTFSLSILGVKIGSIFGTKYKSKAELAGGIILILMGLKILLENIL